MDRPLAESTTWTWQPFDALRGRDVYAILALRAEIFVVEQNCAYQDPDRLDLEAHHCLYRENDRLLAYLRALAPRDDTGESTLGRIVVHETRRGRQLGRALVQHGIDYNLATWPGHPIGISAQAHLEAFYRSLGFESQGEGYLEDGIPHIHMRLQHKA
jgi:ElaA protein